MAETLNDQAKVQALEARVKALEGGLREAIDNLIDHGAATDVIGAYCAILFCTEGSTPSPEVADGWVLVPREITRPMRLATWKSDYLDAGATEEEAIVLAARREADVGEIEGANAAYRAMLAAAPSLLSSTEGQDNE